MKTSKWTILFALVSSALLFFVALFSYDILLGWTIPQGKSLMVRYFINQSFNNDIFYAISISLIPLVIFACRQLSFNKSSIQKSLTTVIFILCSLIPLIGRLVWIRTNLNKYSDIETNIVFTIRADQFNYHIFILAGIFCGVIIMFIFAKIKRVEKATTKQQGYLIQKTK